MQGEAAEKQAVIIDGTSAKLQVSVTSLLSWELPDDFTPRRHAVYGNTTEHVCIKKSNIQYIISSRGKIRKNK